MDAVFAILILGAVIFFGALISAGNERQRKAIDGIREQAALWAMQDLRLKREKLAREVKVDDPLTWLNQVITKVVGEDLGLVMTEVFDNPQAVLCLTKGGERVIISPKSLDEVKRTKLGNKNKLIQKEISNPLWDISQKNQKYELSILNAGFLFDLEMAIAWESLTKRKILQTGRLWIYWQ